MTVQRPRLLLIEDDQIDQMAFERYMQQEGQPYDYRIVDCIGKARELLASETCDLIIADYQLPDGVAIDILEMKLPIPVVITTGSGSEDIAIQAMRKGASDYLIKDPKRAYLKLLPSLVEQILHRRETERLVAMLSNAVRSTSDGICITNMDNEILFVNQALCRIYGYEEQELLNKQAIILETGSAHRSEEVKTEAAFGVTTEMTHRRKDGSYFPATLSRSLVKNDQNQAIAIVTTMRDVTQRKQTEAKMLEQVEQIARTRAELEQLELFSFVSTHDLQEPLHKVLTFSNLIKTDPDVAINEKGRGYLDMVSGAAAEMRQLIAQLHDFAKVMTEGGLFEDVDLGQVVKEVLRDLKEKVELSQAKMVVGEFPTIKADRIQIYRMLYNLIDNALLYRKKDAAPSIKINSQKVDFSMLEITVEDEGIGFDEKHLNRIFKPFQRLHNTKEYPGRGLGLAICQRILLRHQGNITARSVPGKGSAFIVTLPLTSEFAKQEPTP